MNMISDVFLGKKVIEQVIETDSSVVKGSAAVQALGTAEAMRGKERLSPFGSSLSPIGLSSPLVSDGDVRTQDLGKIHIL